MYNLNNKYCTLEILLNELYRLFEVDSPVFIDDLGYKWYELVNVLRILQIDEEEYINGCYLMTIEDDTFISEEGINILLLDYDNEYRDEIMNYLTLDVMPDIKSDLMYLGYDLIESVKNISLKTMSENNNEFIAAAKMNNYVSKKTHRISKRDDMRNETKNKKRHKR